MTEAIPVEKILGPESEERTNYQSITEVVGEDPLTGNRETNTQQRQIYKNTDIREENSREMARVSLTCCKTNWFVYDGLGITCAGITYGLIFYAVFVVIGVILLTDFPASPWAYVHSILFTFMAILAISAHARSMTTDPVSRKKMQRFLVLARV